MSQITHTFQKARFLRESSKHMKGNECLEFEVQYNPKEFKYDKKVGWKEHKNIGKKGALEFQTQSPATIQMELIFDTTHDIGDVRTEWVNKVLAYTNADVKPKRKEAKKGRKRRPPIVTFCWGKFTMKGVIEQANVTYLMFAPDGTPIRAKVALKMKEWKPEQYKDGTGVHKTVTDDWKQLVTVEAGQTITAVALANDKDWRELCEQNGIDDPLGGVEAGQQLVV